MKWLRDFFRSPLTAFVLRVEPDGTTLVTGSIEARQQGLIDGVLRENGVRHGTIRGRQRGGKIVLECSEEISGVVAQRLRNVWGTRR